MEPVSIALICALSFGVVVAFSVFVRQLLLSRDKHLNDKAQQHAINQEAEELAKIREEMKENKSRFETHYQVLGANKDAIRYIDDKIEEILQKKENLVQRYAQIILKESSDIVKQGQSLDRKEKCDCLQAEIDAEIAAYQNEIEYYQKRRDGLWDSHRDLLSQLTEQEITRNASMDKLYQKHTSMLQKIFIRHNENNEKFATQTIEAGSKSFKSMIMLPILFLKEYFGRGKDASLDKMLDEIKSRKRVSEAEAALNNDFAADSGKSPRDSERYQKDADYNRLKEKALSME